MLDLHTAAIGTLRVRSAHPDRAALRLVLERQLAAVDWVAGLPPSAILLVRRLEDPLPRRLSPRPGAQPDARWQQALDERVRQLASHAERPQAGRVNAQAEALVFADVAELAACLALELARPGPAPWWRQVVARHMPHASLAALLQAQLQILPAIAAQLALARRLEEVLAPLAPWEALGLCRALAQALALTEIVRVLDAADEAVDAMDTAAEGAAAPSPAAAAAPAAGAFAPGPASAAKPLPLAAVPLPDPLRRWNGTLPRQLGVARLLLAGLALAARHDLPLLAQPAFARRLAEWLRQAVPPGPPELATPEDASPRPVAGTPAPAPQASMPRPTPPKAAIGTPPGQDAGHAPIPELPRPPGPSGHATAGGQEADGASPGAAVYAFEDEGVATLLGGVFYLVNLMEHLELPDGFEPGCGLASTVGAAGTLEALAHGLGGPSVAADDPVWTVLAALDGRAAGTPPRGAALRWPVAHDGWPPAWQTLARRFPPRPAAHQAATLEALRAAAWPAPLLDWLRDVLPLLHARLQAALAADEDESDPVAALLRLPARLHLSEVHLDIVASVEDVSLPLRIAGLDRSPGWVRSMQRVVLFHFE